MNIRIIAPPAELKAAVKALRAVVEVQHVSDPRPSRRNPAERMVYIDAVLPDPTGERA